ncbi:MAG: hypothetical protein H6742_06160 [Alphaproteobacteria bacterium]|nr:hypothetical protein [Alphaproteobacteria bacterium]
MDEKKKLVAVAGLRKADPTTLQVLTQDVLRTPLVRIEPGTLFDLLALSEVAQEQVPASMAKELVAFRAQMFRELNDLPDGEPLAAFVDSLKSAAPDQVPACFRDAAAELLDECEHEDAVEALRTFMEGLEGSEPASIDLPKKAEVGSTGSAPIEKVEKRAAPRKRTSARSTAQVDEERAVWIADNALERLANYHNGLKEAILVAGTAHRAPWDDMTEKEIMVVLRKMKREGRLRFSAGRWFRQA